MIPSAVAFAFGAAITVACSWGRSPAGRRAHHLSGCSPTFRHRCHAQLRPDSLALHNERKPKRSQWPWQSIIVACVEVIDFKRSQESNHQSHRSQNRRIRCVPDTWRVARMKWRQRLGETAVIMQIRSRESNHLARKGRQANPRLLFLPPPQKSLQIPYISPPGRFRRMCRWQWRPWAPGRKTCPVPWVQAPKHLPAQPTGPSLPMQQWVGLACLVLGAWRLQWVGSAGQFLVLRCDVSNRMQAVALPSTDGWKSRPLRVLARNVKMCKGTQCLRLLCPGV